jgi:kinesin family protein 5
MDGAGRVNVFARVRPIGEHEEGSTCVDANDAASTLCVKDEACAAERVLGGESLDAVMGGEGKKFTFDGVFPTSASQRDVFAKVGQPVLRECLKGFNGTILAYGQTGSGKTHSLLHQGQKGEDAGLLPRVVAGLWVHIAKDAASVYQVDVAALQVYNEQVDDLLHPSLQSGGGQNLKVQDGGAVPGLTWVRCARPDAMLQHFARARSNLVYAETKMNKSSSRSHAVFQVKITRRERAMTSEGTGAPRKIECTQGRLNVVDLAGSERVKKSGAEGARFKEATAINTSLLAFGNVVSALAAMKKHVPFRDSKLTRILDGSIGGNCKTTLLVCASPAAENSSETLSSLDFASRCMRVEVDAKVNVSVVEVSAQALLADLHPEDVGVELGPELDKLRKSSTEAVQRAEDEAKRRQKEAEAAQAEMRVLSSKAVEVEKIAKSRAEELDDLKLVQKQFQAQEDSMRIEIAKATELAEKHRAVAEAAVMDAKEQRTAADAQLTDAKAQLQIAQAATDQANKACQSAKERATKAEGVASKLSRERDAALARAQSAEKTLEASRSRMADEKNLHSANLQEVTLQKGASEEKAAVAAAEIRDLQAQAVEAALRGEALEAQLAKSTEELAQRAAAINEASELLRQLREEAEEATALLRSTHAAELRDTVSAHRVELERLREERAQEKRSFEAAAEAVLVEHAARVVALEEAHSKNVASSMEELADVRRKFEATIAETSAKHVESIAALDDHLRLESERWSADRSQLLAEHADEMESQREAFEARLAEGRESFEAGIAALEQTFAVERATLQRMVDDKVEELGRREVQWQQTKDEAVRETCERGSLQQRKLASAFKAARSITAMREETLKEEHSEIARRFAARESRPEDVQAISQQRQRMSKQEQALELQGRHLVDLSREMQNRDAMDKIFGSTGEMRAALSRGRSPLPGKKLGDTRSYPERRHASCRSSTADDLANRPLKLNQGGLVLPLHAPVL